LSHHSLVIIVHPWSICCSFQHSKWPFKVTILCVAGIIGKAKGQLHRLAMVLQSMADASALLGKCGEDCNLGLTKNLLEILPTGISFQYDTETVQHADGEHDDCPLKFVQKSTAQSAVALMTYFIGQKKHMSGYASADPTGGDGKTESPLHLQGPPPATLEPSADYVAAKKLLLMSGAEVPLAAFRQTNRRMQPATIDAACDLLQNLGLGRMSAARKNGPGRKGSGFFQKVDPANMVAEELVDLMESLRKIGVGLVSYKAAYADETRKLPAKKAADSEEADSDITTLDREGTRTLPPKTPAGRGNHQPTLHHFKAPQHATPVGQGPGDREAIRPHSLHPGRHPGPSMYPAATPVSSKRPLGLSGKENAADQNRKGKSEGAKQIKFMRNSSVPQFSFPEEEDDDIYDFQ
jgi:hypothetical protein